MLPLGLGETEFNPDFNIEGMANTLENISIAALPTLDRLNEHRKCLSNLYSEHLEAKYQKKDTGIAVSIIRFPILLPDTILTKEMRRMGIRRMYPKAIFDESSIKPHLKQGQDATFGASEISEKLFTLPTHLRISESMAKELAVLVQEKVRLN